jgi:hypothetical protein
VRARTKFPRRSAKSFASRPASPGTPSRPTTATAPWLLHAVQVPRLEPLVISDELVAKLTRYFALAGRPGVKPEVICGIVYDARKLYASRRWAEIRACSARLGGAAAVERVIELLKQEEHLACFALTEDFTDEEELEAKAAELRKAQPTLTEAQAFAKVYNDATRDISEPAQEWRAWEEYQSLLKGLGRVASVMRTSRGPVKRNRGPVPNRDLDRVVGYLVFCWEEKIVGPGSFSADWIKGKRLPLTPAASFVCDVVEFIDSERLREVPKTIERVRAERKRRATSPISKK